VAGVPKICVRGFGGLTETLWMLDSYSRSFCGEGPRAIVMALKKQGLSSNNPTFNISSKQDNAEEGKENFQLKE
jgi:hypothetical protein